MINELDKHTFYLSCDICGITEEGPFEKYMDAVEYKTEHREEWRSYRMYDKATGKSEWKDICIACFPDTVVGKWRHIPKIGKEPPPPKERKSLKDQADSIGAAIAKRAGDVK